MANPRGEPIVDRAGLSVRFERTLAASPQRVFDAWTQPRDLAVWWNPAGVPLMRCEVDLRVGGTFCLQGPSGPAFEGTYRVVERPRRLVFEAIGAVGTIEIEPEAAGCRLRVIIEGTSAAQFEQLLQAGIHTGTARSLDNLTRYLASEATR